MSPTRPMVGVATDRQSYTIGRLYMVDVRTMDPPLSKQQASAIITAGLTAQYEDMRRYREMMLAAGGTDRRPKPKPSPEPSQEVSRPSQPPARASWPKASQPSPEPSQRRRTLADMRDSILALHERGFDEATIAHTVGLTPDEVRTAVEAWGQDMAA